MVAHFYNMKFTDFIKELYDKAIFYVSVPKCVCCREKLDISDKGLCAECSTSYNNLKDRSCSLCKKPLYECTCANDYLNSHYVHKLVKVYRYIYDDTLPTNKLIYSLKRDNRDDVLSFLSNELSVSIQNSIKNPEDYIVTSVPRRKEAIRKYGIDHARLLARRVAKNLGADYVPLLCSKAHKAQKKMSGKDRIKNAKYEILKSTPDITGKKVILVDDIVTTGASMGSCAMLIHGLGAKSIVGATVSVAYKDKYIPFDTEDRFTSKK